MTDAVADPGFPVGGGRGPHRRGCGLLRRLHFENFVCQNERIGTLRGGTRQVHPPRSTNEMFVYSFYHVHNCKLELSMHWAIWMVQISSTFLRITDKAYFLCIDSCSVHSYENNTDTVTTLQIKLSVVCSKINDNLQCRPQWVTNLVHLKY